MEYEEFVAFLRESLGNGDIADLLDEILAIMWDTNGGTVDEITANKLIHLLADRIYGR